jgi:hypothetical protein
MGGEDMHSDTYSFVVRVWQETADSDGNVVALRGSIDDVGNGERSYFTDLDSILPFIRKQIGWTLEAVPSLLEGEREQGQA